MFLVLCAILAVLAKIDASPIEPRENAAMEPKQNFKMDKFSDDSYVVQESDTSKIDDIHENWTIKKRVFKRSADPEAKELSGVTSSNPWYYKVSDWLKKAASDTWKWIDGAAADTEIVFMTTHQ